MKNSTTATTFSIAERISIARQVANLSPTSSRTQIIALDTAEAMPAVADWIVSRIWNELQIERYHQHLLLELAMAHQPRPCTCDRKDFCTAWCGDRPKATHSPARLVATREDEDVVSWALAGRG